MMDRKRQAFTIVELLVVIGIITLLLSIALPALNKAKEIAKVTRDRATISSMATGIEAFANDMGYYPNSTRRDALVVGANPNTSVQMDQGAHILFESLAGLDLLGYQKDQWYQVDDGSVTGVAGTPIARNKINVMAVTQRYGPYVKLDSVKIGKMQDSHLGSQNFPDNGNENPVFVDSLQRENPRAILYFKANKRGRRISSLAAPGGGIYLYGHNRDITQDKASGTEIHPEFDNPLEFKEYLWDSKTGVDPSVNNDPAIMFGSLQARPYNADSFILINAGVDGLYGTPDDITNYTKR